MIGVDIGGTKSAVVLGRTVGDRIDVLERRVFATSPQLGPDHALGLIRNAVRELRAFADRAGNAVTAIGVCAGGPLDAALGVILSPPNLPGWDTVPIVRLLAAETGLPVRLENDANAGALAEWTYGAGRGTRNLIFCTCGTGFGAGLILDGRLFAGASGMAGEIGHVRLAPDGPVGHGKRGSVEGFCSGGGIAQLAERYSLGAVTAQSVGEAAQAGDPSAQEVLAEVGNRLGQTLAILVDLFNPELIVIGGIFGRQRRFLWPACERVLREEALPRSLAVCRIVPTELGEQIGDVAALTVALAAGGPG